MAVTLSEFYLPILILGENQLLSFSFLSNYESIIHNNHSLTYFLKPFAQLFSLFSLVSFQPLSEARRVKRNVRLIMFEVQFSSVHSLSHVQLFATPWIAVCQASLSITNSRSSRKLMSIESVMPSSHLILCHPLLLLPPVPPRISLFQWVNSSHEVAKVLEFRL